MWLVGLAYWQLLLMRPAVQPNRPAWHPRQKDGQDRPLTLLRYYVQPCHFCYSLAHQLRTPGAQEKGWAGKMAIIYPRENDTTSFSSPKRRKISQ
jgi:hypothetical protein